MEKFKILAVDDEEFNLDILTEYLEEAGFEVIGAEDGVIALQKLEQHPDIDVIVLDRMMPNMGGIEVLKAVKQDSRFKDIPVIMQTAAASSDQVLEGIQCGAYYYLTKPYEDVMLISIVKAALHEVKNRRNIREEIHKHRRVLGLMEKSIFHFRTVDDAKNLAFFMANCFPDPEMAVYGLNELLLNAVEHGNLGITYGEKTQLVMDGKWRTEIDRRLELEENKAKLGYLEFEHSDSQLRIIITDQGTGFDWQKYITISPDRASDPHGRGIAMSCAMSFSTVEYQGCGNKVICTVNL